MTTTPPPDDQSKACPYCGKIILRSATWCPHCGTKFDQGGQGKYRFGFVWFLFLFLIVPLVACGGCFAGIGVGLGTSSSAQTGNIISTVSLVVMAASFLAGIVLLIINGLKGRQ